MCIRDRGEAEQTRAVPVLEHPHHHPEHGRDGRAVGHQRLDGEHERPGEEEDDHEGRQADEPTDEQQPVGDGGVDVDEASRRAADELVGRSLRATHGSDEVLSGLAVDLDVGNDENRCSSCLLYTSRCV